MPRVDLARIKVEFGEKSPQNTLTSIRLESTVDEGE